MNSYNFVNEMDINAFFNDLAANSSRNYKVDRLTENRTDGLLREVIRLALDPFTQFYIRKIPKYTAQGDRGLDWALDQLFELSNRIVTGNAAIDHLTKILESLNEGDAKVIERVIQKDLKCGVQVSTANAVWTGLIKEYPCMLCSPFEQKLVDKITYPAYAQMKMDGMRFNAIVREGSVEFRSRNGKELHLLGNLEQEFLELSRGIDCVFDGELLVMFDGDHQFADRQTGNGILNKANKGTISASEAGMVHAALWDVIPYMYFVDGECPVTYEKRFDSLRKLIREIPPEGKKIWLVAHDEVNSLEEAQAIFEDYLEKGYEGIILKDRNSIWQDKRSKSQIKFKGELECDLRIVGIEEGSGKYAGMLGAILCESEDGVLKVRVGSGFSDEQRKTLGNEIIGKIAAVKYNMRSVDKQGKQSLFLPIILEVREDKTVADSSDSIK